MSLVSGTTLGPYEILALIGEGGMGEVYRARDGRLDRIVALKVSKDQFSERFEREARAVASLNHPNICQLYDVGPNYLVMEFVEGPTLADRIRKGALGFDETLHIARQMAEAIEAAHDNAIIHRDLKPDNVKVTADGVVKVLDFGLAKAADPIAGNPQEAPTIKAGTLAGVIMGTPGYMSPEQARGLPVDRRTDIWAFGVILHEMLTGKPLFEGETVSDTLAEVLKKDIEINAAPAPLRPLLRRCLDRDRKQRLQSIGEARIVLANPLEMPVAEPSQARTRRSPLLVAAIAFLVIALSLALAALWRFTRPVEQPLTTFDVDLGKELPTNFMGGASTILSPDGRRIVFLDSARRLWTLRLDQTQATMLSGTEDSQTPFFSPDGRWVGFVGGGKLKKMMVEGGSAIPLCDALSGSSRGASWGEDGFIIASLSNSSPLVRIPAAGGKPEPVTAFSKERRESAHRWPHILPSGKAVLFTAGATDSSDQTSIEVQTLSGGGRKTLVEGGTFGRYLPTGHLIYLNKGTVFAVPFDERRLEVKGSPTPILEGVHLHPTLGYAQLDFSRDGKLVIRKGNFGGFSLHWLESSGQSTLVLPKTAVGQSRLSPDGKRLALASEGSIWVFELQGERISRLTFESGGDNAPIWSPDGVYVYFTRAQDVWFVRADGSGKAERFIQSPITLMPASFTPDGKRLIVNTTGYEVLAIPVEGTPTQPRAGKPEPFLSDGRSIRAALSPDGRWMAYTSTETGRAEIYVRAYPDIGAKWQVSSANGTAPVWSRNAKELYWTERNGAIMAAGYTVRGNSFVAEKPRLWAAKQTAASFMGLDITPDGKRFLVQMFQEESKAPTHVTFLLGFFDEVKRKLAAAGTQ